MTKTSQNDSTGDTNWHKLDQNIILTDPKWPKTSKTYP